MVLDRARPARSVFVPTRSVAFPPSLWCYVSLCRAARFFFCSGATSACVVPFSRAFDPSDLSSRVTLNGLCRTQICAGLCVDSPFFATQFGSECWCGASDNYDTLGTSSQCSMGCVGTAGEICGGIYAASVYSNSGDGTNETPSPTVIAPTPSPAVEPPAVTLLGCFTDVEDDR